MCPTFVTMFYISDYQMIPIFNFGDVMFFGSEIGEGIEFDFLIKGPIFKSWFLDFDEKEVNNVIKGNLMHSQAFWWTQLWAQKVNTSKGEEVRARSLTHNTSGVEGHVGVLRWD